jgi:folate-dependent phosphoribosylglycinamide formyltransferase PurN
MQSRHTAFLNTRRGFDGDDAMGQTLECTAFHTGRALHFVARGVDLEVLV